MFFPQEKACFIEKNSRLAYAYRVYQEESPQSSIKYYYMNIYLARVLLKDKKVSLLVEGVDEQSVKTSLRAQGYSVVEVRLSDEEEGREFFFFQASDESGATQE